MPFGLMEGLEVANGVTSLVGALGAARRLKQAQEHRQRLLMDYSSQLDRDYQDLQGNNLQALRRNTGLLGDSLKAQGSDMGAALAGAGVSNSSATAGALANQAGENAAALAANSGHNFQTEQSLLSHNRQDMLGKQMDIAGQDVDQARQDQAQGWAGFSNSVGGMAQAFQQAKLNNNRATSPLGQNMTTNGGYGGGFGGGFGGGVGFNGSAGANMMSSRMNGAAMNGNQGMALPGTSYGNLLPTMGKRGRLSP